MKTLTIKQNEVENVFNCIPNGHFFGVSFEKKDHTIRNLNGRKGVKKYLVENPTKSVTLPDNMIRVYDVVNAGYRTVTLDKVISIRAQGKLFVVR